MAKTRSTATRGSRSSAPAKRRRPARVSAPALAPTLGPFVCRWIERNLVHGQGDYLGKPWALRPWERALLYRAYELKPNGDRLWRHVLWGLPKGNAKTEIGGAVACVELAGPSVCMGFDAKGKPLPGMRTSADIPVAAASFEQADLVFGSAKMMLQEGPLREHFEIFDTEILIKGRPGRLYRVAAVAGTNDGARPTFSVRDELHEWTGNKERVHLVLQNNLAKRANTWALDISTAGWDTASLLGKLHARGKRIARGEEPADGFLMEWFEAPDGFDLSDETQFAEACRLANPALGDFLALENLRARYRDMPEFEFRRYHLNQWTSAPERWLPEGAWDAAKSAEGAPPEHTPIVLGFDGSWNRDCTAIVGSTLTAPRHLFKVRLWERPSGQAQWNVSTDDVKQELRNACARWDVRGVACDPFRWQEVISGLLEEGLPMLEWPSHQPARMAPACTQFYNDVANAQVTHDGDPDLARHIGNPVVKIDSRGARITKDAPNSERHIDLAVCAIIANDLAVRNAGAAPFVGISFG